MLNLNGSIKDVDRLVIEAELYAGSFIVAKRLLKLQEQSEAFLALPKLDRSLSLSDKLKTSLF